MLGTESPSAGQVSYCTDSPAPSLPSLCLVTFHPLLPPDPQDWAHALFLGVPVCSPVSQRPLSTVPGGVQTTPQAESHSNRPSFPRKRLSHRGVQERVGAGGQRPLGRGFRGARCPPSLGRPRRGSCQGTRESQGLAQACAGPRKEREDPPPPARQTHTHHSITTSTSRVPVSAVLARGAEDCRLCHLSLATCSHSRQNPQSLARGGWGTCPVHS